MSHSRREFLQRLLALTATGYFAQQLQTQAANGNGNGNGNRKQILLTGDFEGEYKKTDRTFSEKNSGYTSAPGSAVYFDLATKEVKRINVPFLPHGFSQDSRNKNIFYLFEKWGAHAAAIEIGKDEPLWITKAIDRRFFGHGAQIGDFVYVSQMNDIKNWGSVGIYNANDGKFHGEFSSSGTHPHECIQGPDGNLWQLDQKKFKEFGSNLNVFEVPSGKLLRKKELDFADFRRSHHMQVSHDGWTIVSGFTGGRKAATQPSLVCSISPSGKFSLMTPSLDQAPHFKGESLSLAIDSKRGRVAITNPESQSIFFWDYKKNVIERELLTSTLCAGIVYLEKQDEFIYSSKNFSHLKNTKGDGMQLAFEEIKAWGRGSHMYLFHVPA